MRERKRTPESPSVAIYIMKLERSTTAHKDVFPLNLTKWETKNGPKE